MIPSRSWKFRLHFEGIGLTHSFTGLANHTECKPECPGHCLTSVIPIMMPMARMRQRQRRGTVSNPNNPLHGPLMSVGHAGPRTGDQPFSRPVSAFHANAQLKGSREQTPWAKCGVIALGGPARRSFPNEQCMCPRAVTFSLGYYWGKGVIPRRPRGDRCKMKSRTLMISLLLGIARFVPERSGTGVTQLPPTEHSYVPSPLR